MQPGTPTREIQPGREAADAEPYRRRPSPRITLDRVFRFVVGAAVAAVAVWFLWYFLGLVVYLIIGVVLAYLMRPLANRIEGFGLGRIPAILLTFVIVFGGIGAVLTWLVPVAGGYLGDLSRQISFETVGEVVAVEPGGAAGRSRLKTGDVILEVEDQPWGGVETLETVLLARKPGDQVMLTVEDETGRRRLVPLQVEAPAEEAEIVQEREDPSAPHYVEALGLTVQEATVSAVATSIERRLREMVPVPVEKGAIFKTVTGGLQALFREDRLTSIFGSVVGIFTDIFYAVLVIPFVAFFFLKDGSLIQHSVMRLVPNRYFEITLAIVENIETNIGRYFRALFLQCLSVAAVAATMLSIFGVNYAVAVGVFAGLANTIPYFGPLMGFLAGTLVGVAQTGDFSLTPGVLVAMGVTQVMDNVFFQPFYFARAARAHPLVILFVVLIGARLAGLVGMLVAIPLSTILRVIVRQVHWSLRNYRILKSA